MATDDAAQTVKRDLVRRILQLPREQRYEVIASVLGHTSGERNNSIVSFAVTERLPGGNASIFVAAAIQDDLRRELEAWVNAKVEQIGVARIQKPMTPDEPPAS